MNTNGCPPGLFTDDILIFDSQQQPHCNAPVAGYITLLGLQALLRVFVSVVQVRYWNNRVNRRTAQEHHHARNKRRYPIVPTTSSIAVVFQIVFLILTSLNLANTSNSVSVIMLGLFYTAVMSGQFLLVRRYIRLGKKLLPKGPGMSVEKLNSLAVNDMVLNVLLFGMRVAGLGMVITSILSVAAYPSSSTPFQIMEGFVGLYQVCAASSVAWQLRRCIRAVTNSRDAVQGNIISDRSKASVEHATKKMRQQQIICLAVAIFGGVFNLLVAVNVVQLNWWLVCVTQFGYENLFEAFSVWNMTTSFEKSQNQHQQNQTQEGDLVRVTHESLQRRGDERASEFQDVSHLQVVANSNSGDVMASKSL